MMQKIYGETFYELNCPKKKSRWESAGKGEVWVGEVEGEEEEIVVKFYNVLRSSVTLAKTIYSFSTINFDLQG